MTTDSGYGAGTEESADTRDPRVILAMEALHSQKLMFGSLLLHEPYLTRDRVAEIHRWIRSSESPQEPR